MRTLGCPENRCFPKAIIEERPEVNLDRSHPESILLREGDFWEYSISSENESFSDVQKDIGTVFSDLHTRHMV